MSNVLIQKDLHNCGINEISCLNPKFILNPNLAELLGKYHVYYLNGTRYYYQWNYRSFYFLDKRPFYKYYDVVCVENSSEFFVLDESTGQTFPIFLRIPCGHCSVCLDKKVNDFVTRCKLESQLYDVQPWFFTLTYDDKHLPDCGVNVRDIQLFMKRFRVNLFRRGYFAPIRYACSGEYGHNTHRAHYHLIVWNIVPTQLHDIFEIPQICQRSWQNGEVRRPRQIDCSNDKTFYYTAKYMRKPSACPVGKNKPFTLSSRRNGGLGSQFILKHRTSFQKHPHIDLKFKNKWTGRVEPVALSGYLLNKLLPSFCTAIPSKFRTALRNFSANYKVWQFYHPDLTFLFDKPLKICKSYENLFYFGSLSDGDLPSCLYHDDALMYSGICKDADTIVRLSQFFPPSEFKKAEEVDKKRSVFLGNPDNFTVLSRESIIARGYRATRTANRRSYAEVF